MIKNLLRFWSLQPPGAARRNIARKPGGFIDLIADTGKGPALP
jgi:hypothetical protein